jgi:hypothetical protein
MIWRRLGRAFICIAQLLCWTSFSKTAVADPYHFSDILPGDRAMGMGGAFGAVADDSSAIYYNPAGLAFASSSNISASVNAIQFTRREYQKLFNDQDSFFEKSQDVVPTFTGGVIDLTRFSETLHGAFNLQALTQQSNNQNDIFRRPEIAVEYFHRSSKSQNSEILFGTGLGKRFAPNLAFGLSLGGRQTIQDQQTYQDVSQIITPAGVKLKDAVAANKSLFSTLTVNERATASALAAELGMGAIWSPQPAFSIGISGHIDALLQQELSMETDSLSLFHYNDYSLPAASDFELREGVNNDAAQSNLDRYTNKTIGRVSSNNSPRILKANTAPGYLDVEEGFALGRSRMHLSFAAFPSSRLVLAGDIIWHSSQTEWIGNTALVTESVINTHLGSEYFFSPTFFVRTGVFTNKDSRSSNFSPSNTERIDFYGTSFFAGTQTSDTQFSGGLIYQYGIGEALKIAGQTKPKPVREDRLVLGFTATHGL